MELIRVKNENGLELTVLRQLDDVYYQTIYGGMWKHPIFEEYLELFDDKFRPYFILIKKAIEELNIVGDCAETWANDLLFKFSDDIEFVFTWRAWGDLMSAIVGKREGYMAYYMNNH